MRQVKYYIEESGNEPFIQWLRSLPMEYQAASDKYIRRVLDGGSRKNVKPVGEGIFEIKINYGPGIRIYFWEDKNDEVLLHGGVKKRQQADIERAQRYWRNLKR